MRLALTLVIFLIGYFAFSYLPEQPAIITFIAASMLLPFIWSSYKIVEVNPKTSQITLYYWITGLKWKKKVIPYQGIDSILIKDGVYHRGFLKLSDEQTFYLISDKNMDTLRDRLSKIAEKLNCDLTYT